MSENIILQVLVKAVTNAEARHRGLGMTNTAGLGPEERAKLTLEYEQALKDWMDAKRALELFMRDDGD